MIDCTKTKLQSQYWNVQQSVVMHSFNLLVNMKLVFYGFQFLFSIFLLCLTFLWLSYHLVSLFAELNSNSHLKFPVYLVAASDLCHLPNISLRIDDRFLSLCSSASCGN